MTSAAPSAAGGSSQGLQAPLLAWYQRNARDLPWRDPTASPWSILVSEVMLQQTPVSRVEPVWHDWMRRWPTPRALAAESSGEAVRAWGRLGYPRRAIRLHACASTITRDFEGQVPAERDQLLALPGVGSYTAAAVAAFAFGQRATVVDTNIRRVLARAVTGHALPAPTLSAAETLTAQQCLPEGASDSVRWNSAVMELGALVCTAKAPACQDCPLHSRCAWVAAGQPAYTGPPRRGQAWRGTDRQCRGQLLHLLREAPGPLPHAAFVQAWPHDAQQRERCLHALVAEGLLVSSSRQPENPTGNTEPSAGASEVRQFYGFTLG